MCVSPGDVDEVTHYCRASQVITDRIFCELVTQNTVALLILQPFSHYTYEHRSGLGFDPRSGPFPGWGFLRSFPSTVREMPENWDHIRPRLSYGHHISIKPYIIRLRTATVSDNSCSTWPSLTNNNFTYVFSRAAHVRPWIKVWTVWIFLVPDAKHYSCSLLQRCGTNEITLAAIETHFTSNVVIRKACGKMRLSSSYS